MTRMPNLVQIHVPPTMPYTIYAYTYLEQGGELSAVVRIPFELQLRRRERLLPEHHAEEATAMILCLEGI